MFMTEPATLTTPKTNSKGKRMQKSRKQRPVVGLAHPWIVGVAICCLVAISVSSYLSFVALTSSKIAGCGEGQWFNCSNVISSRWSLWMGIPVSLLSVVLYISLATALWVGSGARFLVSSRKFAWMMVTLLGISAGLAACWFVSLQVFVLNHLCTYCMVVHTCGLIVAGIVLAKRPISDSAFKCAFAAGLASLGILIGGQIASEPPPTFKIEKFELPAVPSDATDFTAPGESGAGDTDDNLFDAPVINNIEPSGTSSSLNPANSGLSVYALVRPQLLLSALAYAAVPQESPSKTTDNTTPDKPATATPRRTVAINGGSVKLDVTQWPIVGSTKAKYIFVEMFDYSCSHCRNTHVAIEGAKKTLGGDVAVVMLPTPLNANCNGLIQVTDPKFAESCEIAKLAIAVWRTDAAAFGKFHEWMFTTEQAPNFASAKAYAESLVDPEKLAAELNSDIPTQYVAKNVELYRRAGGGNVPKLMFPGTSIIGEFTSADALVDVIRQEIK
jgi:uncharacterized membrane protein/protein-disulfide isomerase